MFAQSTPGAGYFGLQASTYSPHGAAAASAQSAESMKAAAELAEMLQRHRPWRDTDITAAATAADNLPKTSAQDDMEITVAR